MALSLYNTLTKKKEEFVPQKEGEVSFYLCGPTVYDFFHIGNARVWVVFDVVRKYLEFSGYKVIFVANLTDVDDKIISRAAKEGVTPQEIAEKYIAAFFEDCKKLKIKDASGYPRATEHIKEMQDLIAELLKKGYAYELDGDVYFEVSKFSEYGQLSGKKIDDLIAGHRVEKDERKRNPLDFAMWKKAKEGEICWESPWGKGRPGWHIECSAMSTKYLGVDFDIHAGGEDLIFPHHENEIAQNRCGYGGGFARYWMHIGFLKINKEKMSKSLGNFYTAREILDEFSPEAVRLFYMQKHYKSPVEFSKEALGDSETAVQRLKRCYVNLKKRIEGVTPAEADNDSIIAKIKEEIIAAMDDDFNSPAAVARVFDLVRIVNEKLENTTPDDISLLYRASVLLDDVNAFLGIIPEERENTANNDELVEILLAVRNELRDKKEFGLADKIRDDLYKLGFVIEDGTDGTRWMRK